MSRKTKQDMTTGPISTLLINFAVPLLLGNLFQQLYNTVDSLIVGNFVGTEALAAIGATTSICNILVNFFNGVSIGAGVIISRNFGAHDDEALNESIETTMAITFLCSILFTCIGYGMTPFLLRMMNTPDDVLPYSTTYLRIYFLGIAGLLIYNMGSGILRAVGDSRRPLMFLIFSSILNIFLDLVFVLLFHKGIAGVAIATIMAQGISAVLILWLLTTAKDNYRFIWKKLHIRMEVLKEICEIGLPTGLQQSLTAFSNVFAHSYINVFQAKAMAGWSCYSKIDQFVMLPLKSMGNASTTFVSQNVGAGDSERARRGAHTSLKIAFLVTAICGSVVWIASPLIVEAFNRDSDVVYYGTLFLRTNIPFMMFCCVNQVLAGVLRGIGDAKTPMRYLLFCQVVLRQIYLFIISRLLPGNVMVISLAFPLGWTTCAALMLLHYRKIRWQKQSLNG